MPAKEHLILSELHKKKNIWNHKFLCLNITVQPKLKVSLSLKSQLFGEEFSFGLRLLPPNFKLCFTVHCTFCLHAVCAVASSSGIFHFGKLHGMDSVTMSADFIFHTVNSPTVQESVLTSAWLVSLLSVYVYIITVLYY